jgi:hypothetical protein
VPMRCAGLRGQRRSTNPSSAPRPIEAQQPLDIRHSWHRRRGTTWYQLSRPDPVNHYAALRTLLIQHANQLAKQIDRNRALQPAR